MTATVTARVIARQPSSSHDLIHPAVLDARLAYLGALENLLDELFRRGSVERVGRRRLLVVPLSAALADRLACLGAALDEIEPDADSEPDADDEPDADHEPDVDREPDGDDEPDLTWLIGGQGA